MKYLLLTSLIQFVAGIILYITWNPDLDEIGFIQWTIGLVVAFQILVNHDNIIKFIQDKK